MAPILRFDAVGLSYPSPAGGPPVVALAPIDLVIEAGEVVALVGRSGAGKSTLANLALGLVRPTTGRVLVDGKLWADPTQGPHRRHRALVQGVAQDAGASLPPRWTVERCLRTVVRRLGDGPRPSAAEVDRRIQAAAEIARFDPELLGRRPRQLSGGQAQRAAIARAVVARPRLVVADEPTSALPAETAVEVAEALTGLASQTGAAVLIVTHDDAVADRCGRRLRLARGRAAEEPPAAANRSPGTTFP